MEPSAPCKGIKACITMLKLKAKYYLSLVFICCGFAAMSQNMSKVDGYRRILQNGVADTMYIRLSLDIADEFIFNQSDSSRKYAMQALMKAEEIKDASAQGRACNYLGIIEYSQAHYLTALEYYQRSQNSFKSKNDMAGAMKAANNIAIIYTELEEFDKAISIYEEAYEQNLLLGKKAAASSNLFNIIVDYIELEKWDLAKERMKMLEVLHAEDPNGADPNSLKAELYLHENKTDSALYCLDLAIERADAVGDDYFLVSMYIQRADVLRIKKSYLEAEAELVKAEEIIVRNELNDQKLALLKKRAEILAEEGLYSKAFEVQNEYTLLKDSLDHLNNFNRISELNAKYESEKKETEIARQEQELSRKSLQFRIVLLIGSAILVIAALILYNLLRKRKMNDLLKVQNNEIKVQRQKILSSIDYARRIQRSILPSEETIKKLFPQSFVFFRPRDIVSGDFYWMKEVDNKVLVAIADCTGHGVPGAFMSLIANSKLNKVVSEMGKKAPHEILHAVHFEIVNMLNQREAPYNAQDGMDISLCLIDKNTRTIEFSGANNSIMIVGRDFQEIKAVPLSLGGVAYSKTYDRNNPFKPETIRYEEGDILFMYTDGMLDQLGGSENRKFNKERFRNLLKQLYAMDLDRAVVTCDAFLSQWKMNNAQTDDILLFGTKLT